VPAVASDAAEPSTGRQATIPSGRTSTGAGIGDPVGVGKLRISDDVTVDRESDLLGYRNGRAVPRFAARRDQQDETAAEQIDISSEKSSMSGCMPSVPRYGATLVT
jgi:hypothetical protein